MLRAPQPIWTFDLRMHSLLLLAAWQLLRINFSMALSVRSHSGDMCPDADDDCADHTSPSFCVNFQSRHCSRRRYVSAVLVYRGIAHESSSSTLELDPSCLLLCNFPGWCASMWLVSRPQRFATALVPSRHPVSSSIHSTTLYRIEFEPVNHWPAPWWSFFRQLLVWWPWASR